MRHGTEADIAAIAAIYRHHVLTGLASFEEVPREAAEMARRRQGVVEARMPWLVAMAGGHRCGRDGPWLCVCGALPATARLSPHCRGSVYVGPRQVGRGIGRALLGRLIGRCEALGFRQVVAVIGDSGDAASIGLHRTAGFVRVGLLPTVGFTFGRWLDRC
jgi:phosphinothricin acetyltransferase